MSDKNNLSTLLSKTNIMTPEPSNPSNFADCYKLDRKLMSGSYGTVYVGIDIKRGTPYAVKVVDRSKLSTRDDHAQQTEVSILRYLSSQQLLHPNHNVGIIDLIDFFSDTRHFHIVMELAEGGDVFDRLAKRKVYTEKDARDLARRMLESIQFMHERGIAHRDIKPENLLIMSQEDDTDMKLADFGFARRFSLDNPDTMKTKCGTPAFVPPELISGIPYGPKCDVWSAGCTLFMLLSGRAPFVMDKKKGGKNAMFYKIRAGDYVFYNSYWKHISLNARKLVLSMMQVDPKRRVSAKEALESEWINTPDDDLRRCSLEQSLREIISFHARRKLKGAIGAVMVAAGARFWDISTAAIWRDEMFDSDKAVDGDCKKAEIQLTSGTGGDDLSPYTNKPPTFESLYKMEKKIEEGKHEAYWEGKYLESDNSYTIKVVNRKGLSHADEGAVLNEVAVLKSLRHKHIVNLLDFFEEPGNFYLVLHRCSGGDVLDRVASLNQYSEKDARELSRGLLSAVEFMHNRGIAHRNLKPQSLLLERDSDNTSIKIADFGLAKRVHMPQSLTTLCGSLHYVAPELLKNHPYDESADCWSVGVIIYFLLVGYLPFHERTQQELFTTIRLGKYHFDASDWADVSKEAMDVIKHLLVVDPSSRYTASQALQSEWIKNIDDESLASHNFEKKRASMKASLNGVVKLINLRKSSLRMSDLSMDERAGF